MTRTLDKNRPYGTIFGEEEHGGVFEQDGCLFDGQGNCVHEDKAALAAIEKRRQATTGVDREARIAELQAELAALGAVPDEKPAEEEGAAVNGDRRTKLQGLHATVVTKLAEELGLTPETGAGSKARNIDNILAAEG